MVGVERRSFEDCTQVLFQDAPVAGTGSVIGPGGGCERVGQLQGRLVSCFVGSDFFFSGMEVAPTTVDGNPRGIIPNSENASLLRNKRETLGVT